jgi:outer membrane protein TolC
MGLFVITSLSSTARGFLLFSFFIFVSSGKPVHSQAIEIELHQINELVRQHSRQWQQFDNRLEYSVRGEEAAATRINPSLAYDLEFLDDGLQAEYEHSLYLQKEIRTPGHYRNVRARRDSRISHLEYETESSRAEWLAATRLGFIQIVLGKQEIHKLEKLNESIDQISEASGRRAAEGETSVLDDQLLQMSRYQIQAKMEEKRIETDRLITLWKNRMGFDENHQITFAGNFHTADVVLPDTGELIATLEDSPQAKAHRMAAEAAGTGTAFAQSNRLPSFELSAGYKQINPAWRGFLVGVAIPLPVLSSNSEAISQARALERIEQTNLNYARTERNQVTFQLMNALANYEKKIGQFPQHLNDPDRFLQSLISSYQEGSQSMNDFLNSLNLMAETYQAKYSQLAGYYGIILELEALTGREFVQH